MTKSQINRLGDRLRLSESPDEAAHSEPMAKAQALLREVLGIEATSRLKTINTIIEKLRRERTRLATMQDIAGLRVVSKMGLAEQDELVGKITSLFPGSKVDDRRERPSYGYRAVHIIALVDERPVEIQVRTELQDRWAQVMEGMADELGRGIRYGEEPKSKAAAKNLAVMKILSELITSMERHPGEGVKAPEVVAGVEQLLKGLEAILGPLEEGDGP